MDIGNDGFFLGSWHGVFSSFDFFKIRRDPRFSAFFIGPCPAFLYRCCMDFPKTMHRSFDRFLLNEWFLCLSKPVRTAAPSPWEFHPPAFRAGRSIEVSLCLVQVVAESGAKPISQPEFSLTCRGRVMAYRSACSPHKECTQVFGYSVVKVRVSEKNPPLIRPANKSQALNGKNK